MIKLDFKIDNDFELADLTIPDLLSLSGGTVIPVTQLFVIDEVDFSRGAVIPWFAIELLKMKTWAMQDSPSPYLIKSIDWGWTLQFEKTNSGIIVTDTRPVTKTRPLLLAQLHLAELERPLSQYVKKTRKLILKHFPGLSLSQKTKLLGPLLSPQADQP